MNLNLSYKKVVCLAFLICTTTYIIEDKTPIETKSPTEKSIHFHEGLTFGSQKQFRYDYTVIGTDEKNKEVYGDMNIEAELGQGKLYTHNDPAIVEVVVESNQKGKIIATDSDGNKYFLKIK